MPWAKAGQVTVALGGDIAKEAGVLPDATALQPIAPPQAGAAPPPPARVAPTGSACPAGYPIKGNKSSSGELIYHVPGGQFYDRTQPEECFATEAAAQAAGYRPSQR